MALIRAKVLSSSEDDPKFRVKVFCPNIYDPESPLLEVLGQVPLQVDDIVIVDISAGVYNALIIGKCFTASASNDAQVIFRAGSEDAYTELSVKSDTLTLTNSSVSLILTGDTLSIGTNDAPVKVVINDGENGELINIDDLTTKLNDLVDKYNSHTHSSIVCSWGPINWGSFSGTSGTLTASSASSPNDAAKFNKNDYKDSNVTH